MIPLQTLFGLGEKLQKHLEEKDRSHDDSYRDDPDHDEKCQKLPRDVSVYDDDVADGDDDDRKTILYDLLQTPKKSEGYLLLILVDPCTLLDSIPSSLKKTGLEDLEKWGSREEKTSKF
jgi:hypothetical protein